MFLVRLQWPPKHMPPICSGRKPSSVLTSRGEPPKSREPGRTYSQNEIYLILRSDFDRQFCRLKDEMSYASFDSKSGPVLILPEHKVFEKRSVFN